MEEFFTVVGPKDPKDPYSEIVVAGCVTRNLAHSAARVPHATVQIIPVRAGTGKVFIHQRSKKPRNAPKMWDFFGGHVSFEMGILLSENGLQEALVETALREAREEILVSVDNKPHLFQRKHLRQVGRLGQFTWGIDDLKTRNVEYSTAFVLCIPENGIVGKSPFELRSGKVEWLQVNEISWDDLVNLYRASKSDPVPKQFKKSEYSKGFADGLTRILEQVINPPKTSQMVENAISWCLVQTV